jgi:hypothetical protein
VTKILFVGERRSRTARRMKVRWEDGRLAAKQLFDAFDACGFPQHRAAFVNLFEPRGLALVCAAHHLGVPVIAMGRKVQRELTKRDMRFVPMVHPAARGAIRRKACYAQHVQEQLRAAGAGL